MENKPNSISHRPLSDMEDNGVYFSESIKQELIELREKQHCHYSGLPSMFWYMENQEQEIKNI
jgi:hypothetical protein